MPSNAIAPATNVDGGPPRSPLSKAIDEFLGDIGQDGDSKNPFLKELAQHQVQLPATQGRKTQATSSADSLRLFVEGLVKEKGARFGNRILDRISPFIDGLQNLMMLCESALQASPFGVSIAFAGARVVLSLAKNTQTYLEKIADAMFIISRDLKCYEKFAWAYNNDAHVQSLLASSYRKIIEFWSDTSRRLSQSVLKTVFKATFNSLEKEVQKTVDGLRDDSEAVMRAVRATDAVQQRMALEHDQKRGVAQWIRGMSAENVDVLEDLEDRVKKRHKGTCQWVLDEQRFEEWKNCKENAVLWYNAPPGSGKSVMASTIIKHLQQQGRKTVYFFYEFNNPLRQLGIHGLRFLALQLLTMVNRLPDFVVSRYKTEMERYAPVLNNPRLASEVINELVKQCPDPIHFVIDGLDECSDEAVFLDHLVNLVNMNTYGLVKWLFTSRNHTTIRAAMQKCQAAEIKAETDLVSRDIRAYFSDKISCQECIEEWTQDEDNFLYAKLVCETLQGQGVSCDDEIKSKLRQYPKDLNGYYIRSLEKLSSKSDELQELARRTFMILAEAFRPMSSEELRDLLAVRSNAKDYAESRTSSIKTILGLCAPLVSVGKPSRSASPENATLKLCHKSVHDFFRQDVKNIKNPDLHKFFATSRKADEELGMNCVTYLQYKRYQDPGLDLPSLLSKIPVPRDHAFLRYAATFWTHHLKIKPESREVIEAVMSFVKSPAFWNCMSVQAKVTPYVFGTFVSHGSGEGFAMKAKGTNNDDFGMPLPIWLDEESPEGLLLDRSLCCFVDEWREVLTTSPAGIAMCPPLRKFEASCCLTPIQKPKSVRVAHVREMIEVDAPLTDISLLSATFRGKNLWAYILCRVDEDGPSVRLKMTEVPLFSSKYKSSVSRIVSVPIDGGDSAWTISVSRQAGCPQKVEAWSLDRENMGFKRTSSDGWSYPEWKVPLPWSGQGVGQRKWAWEIVSTQDLESNADGAKSMRILHVSRSTQRATVRKNRCYDRAKQEDSGDDTDTTEELRDTDDETDSEDESDIESRLQEDQETEEENESSETDYQSDAEGPSGGTFVSTDCLIIVPYSGQPFCYSWSSPSPFWSKVTCAIHPYLPLVAVTYNARQLEVISFSSRTKETKHLPELSDLQKAPAASFRELHFSPCGDYLHLLSISFTPNEAKTETVAHVSLSTFSFNNEGDSNDTLLRECPARTCSYRFGESLRDVNPPFALSCWSDSEVIIALPPLTCDPKILKIVLPRGSGRHIYEACPDGGDGVWTLSQPIYFPTSTPRRSPVLLHRTGEKGSAGYIYLALDSFNPDSSSAVACHDNSASASEDPGRKSPPVVLRWKLLEASEWRAWESSVDETASDLKRGLSVWKMLKGGFIDGDKSFMVVTRSGADWKRKGYLSCA